MFPEMYIGDLYELTLTPEVNVSVAFKRNSSEKVATDERYIGVSPKYYFTGSEFKTYEKLFGVGLNYLVLGAGKNNSFMTNIEDIFLVHPRGSHSIRNSKRRNLLTATQSETDRRTFVKAPLHKDFIGDIK